MYNPFINAFRLSPEEAGGGPDLASAISKGLKTGFEPAATSSDLLNKMLRAKMTEPYARRADEWFNAELQNKLSGNQLDTLKIQEMLMNLKDRQSFNDALTSGPGKIPGTGHPAGINEESNISDTNEPNIISPGDPNAYHLDEMWDNPLHRKMLKLKGYDKKEQVKYDPSTGLSSVITTYPSGKVTVTQNGQTGIEAPLTNAQKTQHQNVVNNIPKTTKKIEEIIASPSPLEVPGFRSNEQAAHQSLVKSAAETYAKTKGWPNTNESIRAAQTILGRHLFESDEAYRIRLRKELESLKEDSEISRQILKTGKVWSNSEEKSQQGASNTKPKYGKPPEGYAYMQDPHTGKIHKVLEKDVPKYVQMGADVYEE